MTRATSTRANTLRDRAPRDRDAREDSLPGGVRFSDAGGPPSGQNGPPPAVAPGRQNPKRGRPPGDALGRQTARERYYQASAQKLELANAQKRGELLEHTAVQHAWARVVFTIREGLLNLSAVALQRGLVTREQEPELQTLVDEILEQLAER